MKMRKWFENGFIDAAYAAEREVTYSAWLDAPRSTKGDVLCLPNDLDVATIEADLSTFAAIVIEFPHFHDGRAYSQARRLREQHGFCGDIIARGDVGRDQALFMKRAGVNVFEIPEEAAPGFAEALNESTQFYQSATDLATPVWRLRHQQALAA